MPTARLRRRRPGATTARCTSSTTSTRRTRVADAFASEHVQVLTAEPARGPGPDAQLRRAVPRRGHLRLLRRQGDRHQPRPAHRGAPPATRAVCGSASTSRPSPTRRSPNREASAQLGEVCGRAVAASSSSRATPGRATCGSRSSPPGRRAEPWPTTPIKPPGPPASRSSAGARWARASARSSRWPGSRWRLPTARPSSPRAAASACSPARAATRMTGSSTPARPPRSRARSARRRPSATRSTARTTCSRR